MSHARTAALTAGIALALLACPATALAAGSAAQGAPEAAYDRADFYEPAPDEQGALLLASGARLVQISDEMKYFTKYESHGNYDLGFSSGDGYNALGYYQFDRRYSLVSFLRYCLSYDGEKYAMFEPVVKRADEVAATTDESGEALERSPMVDEDGKLTELGTLVEGAWHAAYAADPEEFSLLQDNYAYEGYYARSESYLVSRGISMAGRADCVKGLVWSATNLFGTAGVQFFLDEAGLTNDMTDRQFVNALVDAIVDNIAERYPSQPQYHDAWIRRYESERSDCLALLPEDPLEYRISAVSPSNGTLRVSDSYATAGATVTVSASAGDGFVLDEVTVTTSDGAGVALSGSGDTRTFVMPEADVTVAATFAPRFSDVADPRAWYFDGVCWIVEQGAMQGYGDGSGLFGPEDRLDRAQMAMVLWNLEGQPEAESNAHERFDDCAEGAWYDEAVAWIFEQGIMNGYDEHTFGTSDPITREQFVLVLWRLAGRPAPAGDLTTFEDGAAVGEPYVGAMVWAVGEQIVRGGGEGGTRIDPAGQLTRGAAASMLQRWQEGA